MITYFIFGTLYDCLSSYDESRSFSAKNQPLDMSISFLELFTQKFPAEVPLRNLLKPMVIVHYILSLALQHLSTSHQVYCSGNNSRKAFNALFVGRASSRHGGHGVPSNTQFVVLCLKVLGILLRQTTNKEATSGPTTLADCLVFEREAVGKLLACLNMCRGESLELVEMGLNILSGDLSELSGLDEPTSVEDGAMKAFCLLYKYTNHGEALIQAILVYFSKDLAPSPNANTAAVPSGSYQMSELLLWVVLKLLDSDAIFQIFYENGKYVCIHRPALFPIYMLGLS